MISKNGKSEVIGFIVWSLLFGFSLTAEAQHVVRAPVIGILYNEKASPESRGIVAFRQQIRALGYFEGKTIHIEYRFADGVVNRVPELSSQLLELGAKIIVTSNTTVVRLIRQVSESIPIVMIGSSDTPDIVTSPSRPGKNVTGSFVNQEISGKHLELLKETSPKLTSVAVLVISATTRRFQAVKMAAAVLGMNVYPFEIQARDDLESLFRSGRLAYANGLLVIGSPLLNTHRKLIIALAEKNHLPAIYHRRIYPEDGGLMSYGPDGRELWRQAALHVDKILKGAKASDLPVEQAMKLELVINLNAAKAIGLAIPDRVLRWADEVIE